MFDARIHFTYGTPLYIRPESYDTKRPYFSLEGAGCRDLEVEKSSLTVFAFISALVKDQLKTWSFFVIMWDN